MRIFRLHILILFQVLLSVSALGEGVIASTIDLTETEFDNLVASNTVAAKLVFRAGDGNGSDWEITADNNDGTIHAGEVDSGVPWAIGSGNTIIVNWDLDGSGNIEFSVVPSGGFPIVVSTSPLTWFDTILVSVENHYSIYPAGVTLSSGNVEGDVFRDILAPSVNTWDGIRIGLNEYDASNQDPLTLSAILTPEMFGPSNDEFHGEIYFLQVETFPEPETALLSLTISDNLAIVSSTNLSDSSSVTNTLQTRPDLTTGIWSNLYSVTGITETNWTIPATATQSFFRIMTID